MELCSCLCPEAYAACLRQTREEPIVVTTPEEYAEAWRGAARLGAGAQRVGRHHRRREVILILRFHRSFSWFQKDMLEHLTVGFAAAGGKCMLGHQLHC